MSLPPEGLRAARAEAARLGIPALDDRILIAYHRALFGSGENRHYTLPEAQQIIAIGQCASQGHDMLWIPCRVDGDPDDSRLYQCLRCAARCAVTYPLDNATQHDEPLFTAQRRMALRQQCEQPNTYRHIKEGHDLVPLAERKWVCSRCDALITFQEAP